MEESMIKRRQLPWPPEHRRNLRRKSEYRFAALVWGSRGDVQPFIALGAELVRRGHHMVIAARASFRALAEANGIEFFTMAEDGTEKLMRDLAEAKGVPDMVRISAAYSRGLLPVQFHDFWEATRNADVVLTKAVSTAPALHVAERRGLPVFFVHIDPGFIPNRSYCLAGDRIRDLGRVRNLLMGRMMFLGFGLPVENRINAWRRSQGMPADWLARRARSSHFFRFPTFLTWSPRFLGGSPEWPDWYVQTGWWRLENRTSATSRIREFLATGPAPLYVGFGSWNAHEKTAVTDAILAALKTTGNRAILLRNTVDSRTEFPANVLVVDDLPHERVFPNIKAAVHHGGAGTVGAAAAAGIPTIVIPAFPAQAPWGHLVTDLGVGMMLDHHQITEQELAAAFREMDRPHLRARADELGAQVRKEGGREQAADEIERRLWEAAPEAEPRTLPELARPQPLYTQREYVQRLPSPDPEEISFRLQNGERREE
jgi:sterol 3beta-glucosyltransferase